MYIELACSLKIAKVQLATWERRRSNHTLQSDSYSNVASGLLEIIGNAVKREEMGLQESPTKLQQKVVGVWWAVITHSDPNKN